MQQEGGASAMLARIVARFRRPVEPPSE
jgi:hypothetical protein